MASSNVLTCFALSFCRARKTLRSCVHRACFSTRIHRQEDQPTTIAIIRCHDFSLYFWGSTLGRLPKLGSRAIRHTVSRHGTYKQTTGLTTRRAAAVQFDLENAGIEPLDHRRPNAGRCCGARHSAATARKPASARSQRDGPKVTLGPFCVQRGPADGNAPPISAI